MLKLCLASLSVLGVVITAPLAFAEPVETDKAVEEMTVIGPKPHKWVPQPRAEQQYFLSLDAKFGARPNAFDIQQQRLAGQDGLNPRSWYLPSPQGVNYQASHVDEIAMMMQMSGRSSGW